MLTRCMALQYMEQLEKEIREAFDKWTQVPAAQVTAAIELRRGLKEGLFPDPDAERKKRGSKKA